MVSNKLSIRKNITAKNGSLSTKYVSSQHSTKSDKKKPNADIVNKYVFPLNIINTYNANQYVVTGLQRQGKFGGIFIVTDKNTNELKSVKFGLADHYQVEIDVFTTCIEFLPDTDKICKFFDYGFLEVNNEPFILMENMSLNLGEYIKTFFHEKFDTITGITILIECLKCIHFVHEIGFVHRNIKPSSFYIELNTNKSIKRIFISDFEGAQRLNLEPSKLGNMNLLLRDIYVRRLKKRTCGLKYCPLRQHNPTTPIPKDDLESWFYMGVNFFEGTLPWIKFTNHEEDKVIKAKQKMRDPKNKFFKNTPIRFSSLLSRIDEYIESIVPDYTFLIERMEKYRKYLLAEDKTKVELSKDNYIEEAEKHRKEEFIEKGDGKGKKKQNIPVKNERFNKSEKKKNIK